MHYRDHFDHEMTTALVTLHNVMLERELRTAAECFSTTRFAPGVTGQSQDAGTYQKDFTQGSAVPWSDSANAQPIEDIFVAQQKIFQKFGCYADCLLMNETAFRHLRLSEQIQQRWMALGAGRQAHQAGLGDFDYLFGSDANREATGSAIAQVLDVDQIVVGASVMDANNSNDTDFSLFTSGATALYCSRRFEDGGRAMHEIGLGHTFQWTPDTNNNPQVVSNTHGLANVEGFFVEDYLGCKAPRAGDSSAPSGPPADQVQRRRTDYERLLESEFSPTRRWSRRDSRRSRPTFSITQGKKQWQRQKRHKS